MKHQAQIKMFFGLMLVSRRTVCILAAIEVILAAAAVAAMYTVLGRGTGIGREIDRLAPWFYPAFPWVLGGLLCLDVVGVGILLRKLRQREEFLHRERLEEGREAV